MPLLLVKVTKQRNKSPLIFLFPLFHSNSGWWLHAAAQDVYCSEDTASSYCHLKQPVVKHCNLLNCSFSLRCFETAQMTSGFFFLVLLLQSYVLEEESCVINSWKGKSHGEEMTSLTAIRKKLMSPTNHQSKLTNRFPCPENPEDDNCILNCHFGRPRVSHSEVPVLQKLC